MLGFAHTYPPGFAVGGSGALTDSLIHCLTDNGAELRNDSEVLQVLVEWDAQLAFALRAETQSVQERQWSAKFIPGSSAILLRDSILRSSNTPKIL